VCVLVLAGHAAAGEVKAEFESFHFTLRDVLPSLVDQRDTPSGPPRYGRFDLRGLGLRAHLGLDIAGGRTRFVARGQRLRDTDDIAGRLPELVPGVSNDQRHTVGATQTSLELRWEQRVARDGALALRTQVGYRFQRSLQFSDHTRLCPTCRGPRFTRRLVNSRLTGHGLRAGLGLELRPERARWTIEAEAGLALLVANEDQRVRAALSLSGPVDLVETSDGPLPSHKSSSALDLSVRSSYSWRALALVLGYRMERWAQAAGAALDRDNGFDGLTLGLRLRLGH
jgi:hypothetical protein